MKTIQILVLILFASLTQAQGDKPFSRVLVTIGFAEPISILETDSHKYLNGGYILYDDAKPMTLEFYEKGSALGSCVIVEAGGDKYLTVKDCTVSPGHTLTEVVNAVVRSVHEFEMAAKKHQAEYLDLLETTEQIRGIAKECVSDLRKASKTMRQVCGSK